eukprot:CAMPEP_0119537350 /NCGR_PEP_ID=MMETSP1344-20130328/50038_1 /TAXON_ID=236787 /ORGANISM="Florenciella parvula, Strain CCMP2471" /LENGTH=54 /DNA_ID=CAMNT_0007579821 /DNA_START=119 /DNA_END=280 /DNA_ORIENTATION=+
MASSSSSVLAGSDALADARMGLKRYTSNTDLLVDLERVASNRTVLLEAWDGVKP